MSISKDDILTFVNNKLHRSETDIDEELKRILDDLADENLLEEYEAGSATASGDTTIAQPTDYKQIISIWLNDGTTDGEPLKAVPGGYKEYLMWVAEGTSADYSESEYYAEFNGLFYIYPVLDGVYTPKFSYYRYHPALSGETDEILFGNEFDKAIKYGVIAEVALTKKIPSQSAIWYPRYESEKQKRIDNMKPRVYVVGGY